MVKHIILWQLKDELTEDERAKAKADIKEILPHNYLGLIGAFMVAMGVLAQFVRQKNLVEQRKTLEDKP